jgi:hypothetical protein
MMSYMKFTACFEPILAKGLASIHLVNLSTVTSRSVKPLSAFLKALRRSRPHTTNGHVIKIVYNFWAAVWFCLVKYWHPLYDLMICTASLAAVDQ